jgi:hypothetical protein
MMDILTSLPGHFELPWVLPLAVLLPLLAIACHRAPHRGRSPPESQRGERKV